MTHRTGLPHEMTAEQVLAWRAVVWPILVRLCELQAEVAHRSLGYDHANDCFCGTDGFWPDDEFRSDQTAIDFIERTVRDRLDELARRAGKGPG